MYTVTPERVLIALAFYALLWVSMTGDKRTLDGDERKTWLVLGLGWAGIVFGANFLLYKVGWMSFLPWVTNALHTFVWIFLCLTYMYMGVRETRSMLTQFILFFVYSLIVKYAEQMLFGTWDHGHFLGLLCGNHWYVLGWSFLDGFYPLISLWGLRVLARLFPKLGLVAQ